MLVTLWQCFPYNKCGFNALSKGSSPLPTMYSMCHFFGGLGHFGLGHFGLGGIGAVSKVLKACLLVFESGALVIQKQVS